MAERPGILIGLDAGGGSGRALALETETGAVHTAVRPWRHPVAPGTGGLGYDLDLDAIWSALCSAVREVFERADADPQSVRGIAASAMRHSVIAVGARADALYAGSNRDARAAGEGLALAAQDGDALAERAGQWPLPIHAAPRLQWWAARAGELARDARFLSLGDWLGLRLSGQLATDVTQAGETLLLDLKTGDWAWDWIERLALPHSLFPPLHRPGDTLGALTDAAAAELGLPAGTPVAVGGGDTQLGLLGAGALSPGDCALIAGTTAPVQLILADPRVDPHRRVWTGQNALPGTWVLESNAGPVGDALDFAGGILFPDAAVPAARLLAEAAAGDAGAAGVTSTLGAEIMNARDMQLPLGTLSLSHLAIPGADPGRGREQLCRAVAEGIAYALRGNLEQLETVAGTRVETLAVGGGLARSRFFAQLLADVIERPVDLATTSEATALGAALCAGVAAGTFADLSAASRSLADPERVRPTAETAHAYGDGYAAWRALRDARSSADGLARTAALGAMLSGAAQGAAGDAAAFRPRILVTADLDPESLEALRGLGDVQYASFREAMRLLTGPSLVSALEDVHVFVSEVDVVDADALAALSDLRVVVACRGDAVNVDVDACTALGIPVLHTPGRNADAVADLTLGFLLMLARKLPDATAFLRAPDLEAGDMGRMGQAFSTLQGRELWRRTVGLVGLGAVGRGVARRLAPFGARVLVHDPFTDPEHVARAGAESVALDRLLRESDFVSLHAAVTESSRGLIGADELARMRPGACLLNTARAALVDEDALADAIGSGHLGGAALDVFSVEPPGADHPLLALPNVIATPHVGGNTVDVAAHQGALVVAELRRLLSGERPHHALNPAALERFDWNTPAERDASALRALAGRPGPAVSDLQRSTKRDAPARKTAAPSVAAGGVAETLERIVDAFVEGIAADDALLRFSADRDVTLHFLLPDAGIEFHFRLDSGTVRAGRGAPVAEAEVQLRMKADVFDGMFTGRVNPMQKAMSGELSFTGDAAKAMTLQHMQRDLSRLYGEAREAVGDPGDLTSLADPSSASGSAAPPVRSDPGDVRQQICTVVEELYATQLITATGGNVSASVPGESELWITPSQLFKGDLRPEVMVRIDLDGKALDEGALSPSSERLMHCAVYRARSDAAAVIHAHAPHATILANTGLPFLPISTEAAFFGNLPRIPFIMPGTDDLARAIEEAVRESWAVLMQNHGLLVAGRSLRRAADMVEIVERTAEVILGCYAVGREPPVLPDDVVQQLRKIGDLVA